MKGNGALYIQYVGAGFIGWLAGSATVNMWHAFAWIVAWVVVCTAIRLWCSE